MSSKPKAKKKASTKRSKRPAATKAPAPPVAPQQSSDEPEVVKDPLSKIQHPKKRAMILALRKNLGNVSAALRALQQQVGDEAPHRSTHKWWMQTDELYRLAVQDIEEMDLDFVESMLRQRIKGVMVQKETKQGPVIFEIPPDVTAIMFHLNNRGASRGYGNKIEVKHTKGNVIKPKSVEHRNENGS